MTKDGIVRLMVCLGGVGLAGASSGMAAESRSTRAIEEIVVTAQKREEGLQQVSAAVSVLTGDDLTAGNLAKITDLEARIPTVKITEGSTSTTLVNVRGFGSGENLGFEQAVSMFLDGAPRPRSRSQNMLFYDLERAEVLRGPQTTYFGANATAGAFSLVSRKPNPGEDLNGNIAALWNPEFGERSLEGGVSIPLTDTLAVRLSGKAHDIDGYKDNTFLDEDAPNGDTLAGRLSVAWEPTDYYRMDFRVDVGDSETDGAIATELANCPPPGDLGLPEPAPSNFCQMYLDASGGSVDDELDWDIVSGPTLFDIDFTEFVLNNTWQLENSTVSALTTYYEHEFATLATPVPIPISPTGNSSANDPGLLLMQYTEEDFDLFTQEIRFEYSATDWLDYMVGFYYAESELDTDAGVNLSFIGPLPPNTGYTTGLEQETTTASMFGTLETRLTDHLRLNLGLRYSTVRKEGARPTESGTFTEVPPYLANFQSVPELAPFIGVDTGPYPDDDRIDDGFMPSATLEYDWSDSSMVYLTYTEGFKAGGFSVSSSNADVFEEESVTAVEAGLKAQFFDDTLRLNIAAFNMQFDDLQETLNRVNPITGNIEIFVGNVGSVESRGVEFDVTWRPLQDLTLDLALGYLDAKYDEFPDAPCHDILDAATPPPCVADLSGRRKHYAPEWSGTLGATYQADLGAGRLSISPRVDFSDDYLTAPSLDPLSEQDSYAKLNLRVAYGAQDGRWELAFLGENLTDEYVANLRNGIPRAVGSLYVLPGRPRSFSLQFLTRFGAL